VDGDAVQAVVVVDFGVKISGVVGPRVAKMPDGFFRSPVMKTGRSR